MGPGVRFGFLRLIISLAPGPAAGGFLIGSIGKGWLGRLVWWEVLYASIATRITSGEAHAVIVVQDRTNDQRGR